jgi:hypothetical protein
MAECIHGLEAGLCDTCYPKEAPHRLPSARVAPVRAPRAAARRAAKVEPPVTRSATSALDQRVFHVAPLDDLTELLAAGEVGEAWWSSVAPVGASADSVVLVTTARAVSTKSLESGPVPWSAVTLVGVANDPARDRVRAMFAPHGGAVATKVAVNPPWFQSGARP